MQLARKAGPDRSETLDGDLGALDPVIALQLVFNARFDPSQNTLGCVGGGVSAGLAGAGDVAISSMSATVMPTSSAAT
jgi:hypothetical protein